MEFILFQFQKLFLWVLTTSVEATIIILVLLALKKAFNQSLGASWHYVLWFLVLLKLSIPWLPENPFDINIAISVFEKLQEELQPLPPSTSDISYFSSASEGVSDHESTPAGSSADSFTELNSRSTILFTFSLLAWLIGACMMLFILIRGHLKLRVNLNKERSTEINGRIMNLYRQTLQSLGITKNIELRITRLVRSPSLSGLFKPVILLPESMVRLMNDRELRHVFLHELSHYKRKDIALNMLVAGLLCLHWFNPVIWYASYRLRIDQEIACDADVLRYIGQQHKHEYAASIIRLLEIGAVPVSISPQVNFFGYKKQMKRRIQMISFMSKHKVSSFLIGLCIALVVTGLSLPHNASGEKDSAVLNDETEIPFISPAEGTISLEFGLLNVRPNSEEQVLHNGIDIVNKEGTPVIAAAAGTVIFDDYEPKNGNKVIIRHDDNLESHYLHLNEIHVEQGTEVEQGELIALMGSTGNSTGPHLHFSVFQNGEYIDPQPFLKLIDTEE